MRTATITKPSRHPEVDALEALPLDADPLPALKAAGRLRDSIVATHIARVFPIRSGLSADAIAILNFTTDGCSRASLLSDLLALHADALKNQPAVATAIQTAATMRMIDAQLSHVVTDATERSSQCAGFARGVAAQCLAAGDDTDAIVTLATVVPDLEARIAAVEARHRAHAAAQREAKDQDARERAGRRDGLLSDLAAKIRQQFETRFPRALFVYEPPGQAPTTYNADPIDGTTMAARVLKPDDNGGVPQWRLIAAIKALRTVAPDFTHPALELVEGSPEAREAFRLAVADLRARFKALPVGRQFGGLGQTLNGGQFAAMLLATTTGAIDLANLARAVELMKKIDQTYTWPLGDLPVEEAQS